MRHHQLIYTHLPVTEQPGQHLGYWAKTPHSREMLPRIKPFCVWNFNTNLPSRLTSVLMFLQKHPVVRTGEAQKCLLCNEMLPNVDHSDGVFVWPANLRHYVKVHGLALPEDFCKHARGERVFQNRYRPALPWAIVGMPLQHVWRKNRIATILDVDLQKEIVALLTFTSRKAGVVEETLEVSFQHLSTLWCPIDEPLPPGAYQV